MYSDVSPLWGRRESRDDVAVFNYPLLGDLYEAQFKKPCIFVPTKGAVRRLVLCGHIDVSLLCGP